MISFNFNPSYQTRNTLVTSFLLFQIGSLYSLGVFGHHIEASTTRKGALDGVWSEAMSIMTLVSCLAMITAALALNADATDNSVSNLALCLTGLATRRESPLLIRSILGIEGVSFGLSYLVCIELLAAWRPENPGLAIGCGQMAFGIGSIAYSALVRKLLDHFVWESAVKLLACAITIPSIVAIPLISWPNPSQISYRQTGTTRKKSMHWANLPSMAAFWYYIVTVFSAQAGFVFIPYFFTIGASFSIPMDTLVASFQIAMLTSTICRPLAGAVADTLTWGTGKLSIGSRNMMLLLMTSQMMLFLSLIPISSNLNFSGFVIASSLLLATFSSCSCGASILARDIFGSSNSSLVYGVGASLAMGGGDYTFVYLLRWVEKTDHFTTDASKYGLFYIIGFLCGALGLLSCILIEKTENEKDAFLDIDDCEAGSNIPESHLESDMPSFGSVYGSVGT